MPTQIGQQTLLTVCPFPFPSAGRLPAFHDRTAIFSPRRLNMNRAVWRILLLFPKWHLLAPHRSLHFSAAAVFKRHSLRPSFRAQYRYCLVSSCIPTCASIPAEMTAFPVLAYPPTNLSLQIILCVLSIFIQVRHPFSLAKLAQAVFCKGRTPGLPHDFFQVFGVRLFLIQKLCRPEDEKNNGHPLPWYTFPLACFFMRVK